MASDLAMPVRFVREDGVTVAVLQSGAAEGPGAPTLVLFNGDLINVRNIQGGIDPAHGNPNLDLGAGSTQKPGQIVLNWDVGQGVGIFDGEKNMVASVNWKDDGKIHFYLPVEFHSTATFGKKATFLGRVEVLYRLYVRIAGVLKRVRPA